MPLYRVCDRFYITERIPQADRAFHTVARHIDHPFFDRVGAPAYIPAEAVITIAHQLVFHAVRAFHLMQRINIVRQDPDRMRRLHDKVSGIAVWHIVVLPQKLLDLFPRHPVDPWFSVYHAGNRTS